MLKWNYSQRNMMEVQNYNRFNKRLQNFFFYGIFF